MELKILPRNVADMIAAGEVVQRPSSVVKELMENAVDAGADEITVVVTDSGRTLIRVIDNGSGMTPDDAVLCFERHATSKIETPEDLSRILTFGFRGEALASICAVSEVSLTTRTHGSDTAVQVEFAASEHLATREVSAPEGTSVSVRNLFYNIPARRKFLKSDAVELRHIVEEFQRVALTRPDIAFTLIHNGKDVHVLKKAKSLKFRIVDLLGGAVAEDVVDVEAETSIVRISGFAGRPEGAKKTLGNQFFFVNGRFFRSPYLHKAVMKAYENLIPEGVTPSYFLYLEADPGSIDVNIHPTKTEIKFSDEGVLFQIVFAAVREALGKNSAGGHIDFDTPSTSEIPVIGGRFEEYHPVSVPTAGVDPDYDPFAGLGGGSGFGSDGFGERPDRGGTGGYGSSWAPSSAVDKREDYGALFEEKTLPSSQIMILDGRFIMTKSASGVMVVNVRRARERIFYERFLGLLGGEGHTSQTALFPVQVNVGVQARLLFDDNAEMLRSLGFEIDPFGTDTVVVSGVPEGYSAEPGKVEVMVRDLILLLSDNHTSIPGMMEQQTAIRFSVLGASGGEKLTSQAEAARLVDALLSSENPEYTPSGKKIISILTLEELEKRF